MSKATRVAVIGCTGRGDYGHGLDVMWRDVPGCQVVAVADEDTDGRARAAARLGIDTTFAKYQDMIDQVQPDLVAVAPRWADQHAAMSGYALARGIHVYQEKPFCRDLREADALVKACEMTHAKLAVAHQTRYSPRFDRARELLNSGAIGKLLEIRARGKEDQRGGGEDLWVLGSHVLDMARGLAGPAEWCFARVTRQGQLVTRADVAPGNEGLGPLAGDAVWATFGLQDGVMLTFQSVRGAAGNPSRFGIQLLGTKGAMELTMGYPATLKLLSDPSWSPGRSGKRWEDVPVAGLDPATPNDLNAGNVAAAVELLAAIDKQRQPRCSVLEARANVEMIMAVFDSHRQGAPVSLPLEVRENPLTLL